MRTVPVTAERAYQVEIGISWQDALEDWTEGRNQVVVVCSEKFRVETRFKTILIPDGEAGKTSKVIEKLWSDFAQLGLSRDDLIVGIGGGALTDVTGFAAATWLRGIDWIAVPTTLAGAVDASIGGKTGINSEAGKNLIGAFHSPAAVLIDLDWLKTLEPRDFNAGLAEVIKCGFIADPQILDLLDTTSTQELMAQDELLLEVIHRAVSVKASAVSVDFKESFHREILNYGHTVGHAIEKQSQYQLRHGEAVAIGMCFAAELSNLVNGLDMTIVNKHRQILEKYGLPITFSNSAWPEIKGFLLSDKKNRAGQLRFVGLERIGSCNRIENPDPAHLLAAYERISS